MAKLPNIAHSRLLATLMEKFDLVDLYRVYHPNRSDFTFQPKCREQLNRSRIDFILVSNSIIQFTHNCDISPSVPNSLFDHKSTLVRLPNQRTAIAASMLKDPLVDLLVLTSTIECYLHHILISDDQKTEKLATIGEIRNLIRTAGSVPKQYNRVGR